MQKARILILGAGNLATHISIALKEKGHELIQVYSRTEKSAKELAQKLHCTYTDQLSTVNKNVDLVIIAVADNAIAELSEHINFENTLVVHTSGSIPMSHLKNFSESIGVFYPLQSFSKQEKVELLEVPFFIESNTEENKQRLISLAQQISKSVYEINSEQRKQLHLAAVFVNNFVNHLFTIGEDLCKQNELDFSVLHPLINETVRKAMKTGPINAQTGPSKRNDTVVMKDHLSLLNEHDLYQKIYTFVSRSIYETHGNK